MTENSLNILVVTVSIPRADMAAGDRRLCELLKMLAVSNSVDLIGLLASADNDEEEQAHAAQIEALGVRVLAYPRHLAFDSALARRSYEVVMFEFWHVADPRTERVRRLQPWATVIVDTVDVHFVREASAVKLGLMDAAAVAASKNRELAVYGKADAIITVTEEDRQVLLAEQISVPVFIIPIIVQSRQRREFVREPQALFIGGFNHAPNAVGLTWFVKECWPRVLNSVPGALLIVIGSNPTTEVLALGTSAGVDVKGYVRDTAVYLDNAAVSIAPLRFDGGMKGKVCEALAAGMPLVSTSLGVSGLPVQHQVSACVADDPEGFADGVVRCLKNPRWAESMGKVGQELIERLCGPSAVGEQVIQMFASLSPKCPSRLQRAAWEIRRAEFFMRNFVRSIIGRQASALIGKWLKPAPAQDE